MVWRGPQRGPYFLEARLIDLGEGSSVSPWFLLWKCCPVSFFPPSEDVLWALRVPVSVLQDRWDAQPTGKQSLGARLHCCGLRHLDFVIERPEIPALGN